MALFRHQIRNRQNNAAPIWFVSEDECNSIRRFSQNVSKEFMKEYISALFKRGELILPENKLKREKINEAVAVHAYFYPTIKAEEHGLHKDAVKEALNWHRKNIRQEYYQIESQNQIIGVAPDGGHFYYAPEYENGRPPKFRAFSNSQCTVPMRCRFIGTYQYAIPRRYRHEDFIVVIQNDDAGIKMYYIDPETGYYNPNKPIFKWRRPNAG